MAEAPTFASSMTSQESKRKHKMLEMRRIEEPLAFACVRTGAATDELKNADRKPQKTPK